MLFRSGSVGSDVNGHATILGDGEHSLGIHVATDSGVASLTVERLLDLLIGGRVLLLLSLDPGTECRADCGEHVAMVEHSL